MSHVARLLFAASMGLALASGAANAQPAAAASMPMHGASMPHDCMPMSMHGPKEGKGMRMAKPMDCAKGAHRAASEPAGKAKGDPGHDHSKPGKSQP